MSRLDFADFVRVALLFPSLIRAATVTYNWNVTWVTASPDGFARPVIGVNGKWPCPTIEAFVGDEIIVNVVNKLGNQMTSLHWHGMTQQGTNEMDGANMATQCPIPTGSSFTYRFIASSAGSFWWHSHITAQYVDGLRAPMIIHGPDPYAKDYDSEIVLSISDWYHQQASVLTEELLSPHKTFPDMPVPKSVLLNDSSSATLHLDPGKTYKVRVISLAGADAIMLQFDSHSMDIIEVDGIDVKKHTVDQIRVAPAQRYSFLLKAKTSTTKNYAFIAVLDTNANFKNASATFSMSATGYIVYDKSSAPAKSFSVASWKPFDDAILVPLLSPQILPSPVQTVMWDLTVGLDNRGVPTSYLNDTTYKSPMIPTLYSMLAPAKAGVNRIAAKIDTSVVSISQPKVVDIVVNNYTPGIHPFHLHGHHFQVIDRPPAGAGVYTGSRIATTSTPMKRDTVDVYPESYLVIRYIADNPGVWLFHCHNEWHVAMGMTATLIEGPKEIQAVVTVPQDQVQICVVPGPSKPSSSYASTFWRRRRAAKLRIAEPDPATPRKLH